MRHSDAVEETSPALSKRHRARQVESDPRFHALCARDARADGTFYYSVASTGVYCRPSCAARTPRPENVAFHVTRAAAEHAGFRPCKRCKPEQPGLTERHASQVAKLCRLIESSEQTPSLEALAKHAGWSVFHTQRVFKNVAGVSPKTYAAAQKAERVRTALSERRPVTEAIYEAGYGSPARFYEESGALLGMTPRAYRTGGAQVRIRFAVSACALGQVLVAATDRGVCAVSLGDDARVLGQELKSRFPRAEFVATDHGFEEVVAKVVALIERPQLAHDLPLDIRGTVFQERVWSALRQIPAGTPWTYAQLARALGRPRAVRAVASACAANTLAVAVPCHRVVRSDGGLSGYRWGVDRKRALLAREAQK